MSHEIRIKPGVLIMERRDGLFIGHISDQLILPDLKFRALLRALHDWQSINCLVERNHDISVREINTLIEQLHAKYFLEKRMLNVLPKEIVISHMNEIGLAIAPLLLEEMFQVSTLDKRLVHLKDVRGAFVRVANQRDSFDNILASQFRELINSGNLKADSKRGSYNAMQPPHLVSGQRESVSESVGGVESVGSVKGFDSFGIHENSLVLITTYPEPELLAFLMEHQITHLFVSATALGALIGPLVHPGVSPCFHCIELHRSERDPQWQSVALTLFSDRMEQVPMANAHLTSALTAEFIRSLAVNTRILEHVGRTSAFSLQSATSDTGWGIREEGHTWSFHPECSCHWKGALSTRAQ